MPTGIRAPRAFALTVAAGLFAASFALPAPMVAAEEVPFCRGTRGTECESIQTCAGIPGTDVTVCRTVHFYWDE
jgi:hypothetical protein